MGIVFTVLENLSEILRGIDISKKKLYDLDGSGNMGTPLTKVKDTQFTLCEFLPAVINLFEVVHQMQLSMNAIYQFKGVTLLLINLHSKLIKLVRNFKIKGFGI